ncbi:TetR/AcrR family transcriptional regulator [Streptosporangium carneum]|uniref:TetR family transcriptional regulator n=1 Tax=Streptosporangium carneum TaxID=47481 RepID=A0A9W6MH00_9ACTN|nr:TetR/AcrR family transcriptional regulator [Streptosporangium carneum]GLK13781.1 TetR family transcriptional regulator [Streptosporangium carneum]
MSEPGPPTSPAERRTSRTEQRLRTQERILTVARAMFAESGYERTTIRAVATRAEVDPRLVTHYFGSKRELFNRAAYLLPDATAGGSPAHVAESLLGSLHARLEREPTASLAVLRSMMTHPEAAEHLRTAAADQSARIGDAIDAQDAQLRAALIEAVILGVVVGRHQIELPGLRDAAPDQVVDLVRPFFHALTTGTPPTPATAPAPQDSP